MSSFRTNGTTENFPMNPFPAMSIPTEAPKEEAQTFRGPWGRGCGRGRRQHGHGNGHGKGRGEHPGHQMKRMMKEFVKNFT
jgi:hypothetical protein